MRGAAHAAARRADAAPLPRARALLAQGHDEATLQRAAAPVQATIREATSERGMAHLHAADALEARLRELRRPPPDAAAADRRRRDAGAAAAGDARLAHVARRVVPIHIVAPPRARDDASPAASPDGGGGRAPPRMPRSPARPAARRELTKRSEEPPPQRVKWKPPRGVGWGDLPKGTRIQLAGGEYVEAKLALEGRAPRAARRSRRPSTLAYEARLSALYAIYNDPMSALSEARTVRQGATSIEERLRRDVLNASASAPEL